MLPTNVPSPDGEAVLVPGTSSRSIPPPLCAAAQRICQSEQNFAIVKDTIRLFPPEYTNAVDLLSQRPKPWLDEFRECIRWPEHPVPQTSEAQDIVAAIRWRLPTEPWNGDWIVPALKRQIPIHKIGAEMHVQICDTLRKVYFSDMVALYLGYHSFLHKIVLAAVRVCNELAPFGKDPYGMVVLTSLYKILPDRQRLGRWIVWSATTFNPSSDNSVLMRILIPPLIEELFIQHGDNFTLLKQQLLLSESFFSSQITSLDDLDWNALFSVELSLWKAIKESPELLARSMTLAAKELLLEVPLVDYYSNTGRARDIARQWSKFSSDIKACLCISEMICPVMLLAENLLQLGNIHSATAVGLALSSIKVRPTDGWWPWKFINPQDNFAGSEKYGSCCLPYMNRRFTALRKAQSLKEELFKRFSDSLPSLCIDFEPKKISEQKTTEGLAHTPHYTDNLPRSRSRVGTLSNNNISRQKRKAPISNEIAEIKTKRNHAFKDGISTCKDENFLGNTPPGSARSQQASKNLSHPKQKLVGNTPVWTRPNSGFPSEELPTAPSHDCHSKPTDRLSAALKPYSDYLTSCEDSSSSINHQSYHPRNQTGYTSPRQKDSTEELRPLTTLNASDNAKSQLIESPRDREWCTYNVRTWPAERPIDGDTQRTSLPSISRILSHPEHPSLASRNSVLENQEHVVGSNGKVLLNSEQPEEPRLSIPLPKNSSSVIDHRQPPSLQAGELSSLERAPMTCDNTTPPKLFPLAYIDKTIRPNPKRNCKWDHGYFKHPDAARERQLLEQKGKTRAPNSNAPPSELT